VDPDLIDSIDSIIDKVEAARSVPMSRADFRFDRGEMIHYLEELRAQLPTAVPRPPLCWRSGIRSWRRASARPTGSSARVRPSTPGWSR